MFQMLFTRLLIFMGNVLKYVDLDSFLEPNNQKSFVVTIVSFQVTIVNPPESQIDGSSNETSHYQSTSNWGEDIIRSVPSNQTLFDGPPK